MMLYCPNTYGTQTTTSSSTGTTTASSGYCTCPNCGCSHEVNVGMVIVINSDRAGFGFNPGPVILRERPTWPRPRSDRAPAEFYLTAPRTGFERPGRTLRHRGTFRNFHKMHS